MTKNSLFHSHRRQIVSHSHLRDCYNIVFYCYGEFRRLYFHPQQNFPKHKPHHIIASSLQKRPIAGDNVLSEDF